MSNRESAAKAKRVKGVGEKGKEGRNVMEGVGEGWGTGLYLNFYHRMRLY